MKNNGDLELLVQQTERMLEHYQRLLEENQVLCDRESKLLLENRQLRSKHTFASQRIKALLAQLEVIENS
ncbi:MAG: hypothetical protein AB7F64_02455 [Gammaproteobacteria bacterium]